MKYIYKVTIKLLNSTQCTTLVPIAYISIYLWLHFKILYIEHKTENIAWKIKQDHYWK